MTTDSNDQDLRARTADGMRALAHWAASPDARRLPATVRRRAALILLDDLGAIVAGAVEPQVGTARAGFVRTAGAAEATVFAPDGPRLDRYSAAGANGLAAAWCELDEGYRAIPCHAGAYLLAAVLAEAEAGGATTADVLDAIVIAYEITVRIAHAFPFAPLNVHPHAAFATIGAAAGAAVARRLDAAQLLSAVTGAASMSFAGPFNHAPKGALIRNAWTSAGAWIGLRAADWAEGGIGGLPETPYDVFAVCFGTAALPGLLTEGLGAEWGVANGYHKIFACCQYAHSTVEASLKLHERLRATRDAGELSEIVVETHPLGLTLTTVEPETVLAAKFSMPHAAAAVARLGTGGQTAFSSTALHDPAIADLRRRVRLVPIASIGAPPNDRPARVTWRFRDGTAWSESCDSARGGADQPFDDATLLAKLSENTAAVFPAMRGCLEAILAADRDALGRGWAETVRMMTNEETA
ncbi:MAG: MmgE/PrpD family protein [Rhodopila sp.]|nr:MmgE/PrpD family protein [Rhodopila sp.]